MLAALAGGLVAATDVDSKSGAVMSEPRMSHPRIRMSLADGAEAALRSVGGGPMHYKVITDVAIKQSLVAPRSETPWVYMQAAMSQDIRRRAARGETPRFAQAGRGFFRLNISPTSAETAVGDWNREVKHRLREQLREIDPILLEHLVGELLERVGFEDIQVTKRSADGGVDVRAVLTVGGLSKVVTAVQVKRWKRNVPIETVRELRGALDPSEQGLIITISGFTRDAIVEAAAPRRSPIGLLDGAMLVELLAEHGLGIIRRDIALLDLDEKLLSGLVPDEEGGASSEDTNRVSAEPQGERFSLFRLPGGGENVVRFARHAPRSRQGADYAQGLCSGPPAGIPEDHTRRRGYSPPTSPCGPWSRRYRRWTDILDARRPGVPYLS